MDSERTNFQRFLVLPKNWPENAWSFLNYARRAFKSHFYARFKPAHLSFKIRPHWLSPEIYLSSQTLNERNEFDHHKTLGADTLISEKNNLNHFPLNPIPSMDNENYLHFHRWGWLSRKVITGTISQESAFNWINDWIKNNKNRDDPAWEPYSSCERISNLFILLKLLTEKLRKRLLSGAVGNFILDSSQWIIDRLEYYGTDYTNNHILNNGRALALAGSLLCNIRLLDAATHIYKNMLPVLVTNSGFLRERSSHYQLIVLRWILDAERAMLNVNHLVATDDIQFMHHYAKKMEECADVLCDSDGMLKTFLGDVSPDATPEETCGMLNRLYPHWNNNGKSRQPLFAKDGWFVIKKGRMKVISQQPESYPVPYPNHGHADATGFVCLYDDRQLLIDPGRPTYAKTSLSNRMIGGLFHNVPLVNGIAPVTAPLVGNWIPEQYASTDIHANVSGEKFLFIEHNGFSRVGSLIWHVREISVDDNQVTVFDAFHGNRIYDVTVCWHFSPEFRFEEETNGKIRLSSSFCTASLQTECFKNNNRRSFSSGIKKATDYGGWFSPYYGFVEPSITVHCQAQLQFPTIIKTTIKVEPCAA